MCQHFPLGKHSCRMRSHQEDGHRVLPAWRPVRSHVEGQTHSRATVELPEVVEAKERQDGDDEDCEPHHQHDDGGLLQAQALELRSGETGQVRQDDR